MLQFLEYFQYRFKDLLHFRPRAYYRLFELYNADVYPAQAAAVAAGIAILVLLLRRDPWRGRTIAGILAVAWLCVAYGVLWQRLAVIHLVGPLFAACFALEAALLFAVGVLGNRLDLAVERRPPPWVGLGVYLTGLVILPLLGRLFGRPWAQA